ncbi:aconitate hydratase AcnA [Agrobacterium tumefaciens]|uniref:Aconitate hydratase n=1 Tax=Agrobacterium tumefaciens TaxID=358 RepID=A0AA44F6J7_AGRTU|nr:aconitate hydratase AcnA [Agrobacterium tumefaciens]NTB87555.1 aconitate hydratase AcnA [Agrobacterium tumefaciens]NTC19750.1 aconitate hydratase AcnA [Agrobacterium tumefaciens]NTC29678.1 aconitate hydratase AcnA [Agrobacterium tumefaciens]
MSAYMRELVTASGRQMRYYSLPALEQSGYSGISRLPVTIRILLEATLRFAETQGGSLEEALALAVWSPNGERTAEVNFLVNRILLPDSTGVPLLVDLAAMRSAAMRRGVDPKLIEPLVQVDMVVDHSVQIDHFREANALSRNMAIEFSRNRERFEFIKWGAGAFHRFNVVPPGVGICHQVNLEKLAKVVWNDGDLFYPDIVLGADSHTPMVNGLSVLAWGVGGIEAEAAMLGQPTSILTPDVVGVELRGVLPSGVTGTDLVLVVTEALRKRNVVGKFVEFFGEGAALLTVPERSTLANMAPEYGATVGFFAVDEQTLRYLSDTGRDPFLIEACEAYMRAQDMFGTPSAGQIDYSETLVIDLAQVRPSVAGPKRPQDRIDLAEVSTRFASLLKTPVAQGGYGRDADVIGKPGGFGDGDVALAAITSCTNTSNPAVMIAAGLVARNALARGMTIDPRIKTSLAPGSRVVTDYLERFGLLEPLEKLGFKVAAFGCGSCLGNSGPLDQEIDDEIGEGDLVVAAVLSGNRNFEARVHPSIRANFLASPPLVVAFALAGSVTVNLDSDPIGFDGAGKRVYLMDIWPDDAEVARLALGALDGDTVVSSYSGNAGASREWTDIPTIPAPVFDWKESTYIREPPYFLQEVALSPGDIRDAKALAILGDFITTDHISPAGSIKPSSPAGQWLLAQGVEHHDFNTFASRRGNHMVMIRGTFGNIRLRNHMADGREGGWTKHQPSGEIVSIFEAAERYRAAGVPQLVFAGESYGTGSSRDWAAKGQSLLGVRAVIARSFERIHRGNLVGMGILPLEFPDGLSWESLKLDGSESFDLELPDGGRLIKAPVYMTIRRSDGIMETVPLTARIDTPFELSFFTLGGLLPTVFEYVTARQGAETSDAARIDQDCF